MTVQVSVPGSFSGPVELADGATVEQLLGLVAPEARPSSFRVQVNRTPCGLAHVLRSGDRVRIDGSVAAD